MILFINACIRKNSRTKQLADHLINKFNEPIEEINLLDQHFPFVDEDFLNTRDVLLKGRNYDDPLFAMARQFRCRTLLRPVFPGQPQTVL